MTMVACTLYTAIRRPQHEYATLQSSQRTCLLFHPYACRRPLRCAALTRRTVFAVDKKVHSVHKNGTVRKALIIGGGIAGPALALLLKKAQLGISPIVFESTRELEDVGGGFNISPNGLRVLDTIGVANKVIDNGHVLNFLYFRKPDGTAVASSPIGQAEDFPSVGTRRYLLNCFLREEMEREGIPLLTGKRLAAIRQPDSPDSNAPVVAGFKDGSEYEGDMLFGCDGINSATREAVFNTEKPRFTGDVLYLALTPNRPAQCASNTCNVYMGPGKHVGAYPLADDWFQWWALIQRSPQDASGIEWGQVTDVDACRRQLLRTFSNMPAVHDMMLDDGIRRIVCIGTYTRAVERKISAGRVAVLGDAANPIPPHAGQGANKALEDGGVLVQCLKATQGDVRLALQKYEQVRYGRVQQLHLISQQLGRVRNISNPLVVALRDSFMGPMSGITGKVVDQQLVSYDFRKVVQATGN